MVLRISDLPDGLTLVNKDLMVNGGGYESDAFHVDIYDGNVVWIPDGKGDFLVLNTGGIPPVHYSAKERRQCLRYSMNQQLLFCSDFFHLRILDVLTGRCRLDYELPTSSRWLINVESGPTLLLPGTSYDNVIVFDENFTFCDSIEVMGIPAKLERTQRGLILSCISYGQTVAGDAMYEYAIG